MVNDLVRKQLLENWRRTTEDVCEAITRAGRPPGSVRVIGVSKYVDAQVAIALCEAGCGDLAESRPQQLMEKASAFKAPSKAQELSVCWHMIGHLQRNKAKRVVEVADVIHSIDSLKLLSAVAEYARQVGRSPQVLMEANISGEPDKHGFTPEQLLQAWPEVMEVTSVPIVGLMGMAGLEATGDETRQQFAALRTLRNTIVSRYGTPLPELSMGMSDDFEEAIIEGASIVRIGSRLFEGLLPPSI